MIFESLKPGVPGSSLVKIHIWIYSIFSAKFQTQQDQPSFLGPSLMNSSYRLYVLKETFQSILLKPARCHNCSQFVYLSEASLNSPVHDFGIFLFLHLCI